jgi:hypothetical protein
MAQAKTLVDEHGIINEACKILPNAYKVSFLEALGELEDNNRHKFKKFPKTCLHRVRGTKQIVYRADIDKTSSWRIHLQHIDGILYLRDIIEGQKHDDIVKVIKKHKQLVRRIIEAYASAPTELKQNNT